MAYTTINKSTDYFNTKLYTGNGTTDTAITGVGFQPDLSIIKARDMAYDHNVMDAVRGSTKRVATNLTDAESTQSEMIKSFASDGFNLGNNGGVNQSTKTYVAWNWKANGAGSANTDGSITSTVSANTTSGFSIVKWTGNGSNPSTVGHGLGAVPKMIITKRISGDTASWHTYHASIGNAHDIYLNGTNPKASDTSWNSTTPTSSVFTINGANVNVSGAPYIAYCFADVTGFSKFGGYMGDYNANGNFCYLGFKPAFVILKNTTSSGYSWELFDNKRNTTDGVANVIQKRLYPDSNAAEGGSPSTDYIDFLSNGFKIRRAGDSNENNSNYIFMAFAEAPLVGSNNVPCTAR